MLRFLSMMIGLVAMAGAIIYTYQYFSTQSRADAPVVTYSLSAGNCKTRSGAATCTITGEQETVVPVTVELRASGDNKMSGVDLIFAYNTGTEDMLEYQEGATSLGFDTKAIEETVKHKRTGNGRYLHLTLLADKTDRDLPGYDNITLNFKIKKTGTTRIMLITAASTIVGPQGNNAPYDLQPQSKLAPQDAQGDALVQNVYNIKVMTSDQTDNGGNPVPTGSTGTPPTQTTPTNDDANDSLPVNRKDISVNLRMRLQGITSQPKNSSPIDVKVKLVEGRTVPSTYETISFTPQGDGTYVADHTFKAVNVNGLHSLLIKGPKHIQKRICDNAPTEQIGGTYKCNTSKMQLKEGSNTLNFTSIILLSGDIPLQNGIVDAVDIAFVRNSVGKTEADIIARADLNYDGVVDTQDYTLIINALAFKYDE